MIAKIGALTVMIYLHFKSAMPEFSVQQAHLLSNFDFNSWQRARYPIEYNIIFLFLQLSRKGN